jgi:secondary thiamine-phosphate synthase enzyme
MKREEGVAVSTEILTVRAPRRGLHDITPQVARMVEKAGLDTGMCSLFIRHTSASLVVQENYDPSARADLETFMDRLIPSGASWITHTLEGDDDMPSHIKAALTQVSLTIPILEGRLALGAWQGIYLWEHRDHPTPREILVSLFR